MPSPIKIRKEILLGLKEYIIPALHQQQVALGCVMPPFQFPPGITARLINKSVPRPDVESQGYPVQRHWSKAKMHATVVPYIGFIYQGAADDHTIVNSKQAVKYKVSKGIYSIHWQAPSVLMFPPGMPRNVGDSSSFWDSSDTHPEVTKFLWFECREDGLLVHTHSKTNGDPSEVSHSLMIPDLAFVTLIRLFNDALQNNPIASDTAQAMLLASMLRLQDYLTKRIPKIANTSRPPTLSLNNVSSQGHSQAAWQKAIIFIQMNLHEELSVASIAQEVQFSPAHLNRLFHEFSGTSVMRYVRLQRINAAKAILVHKNEAIKEIASLVGFRSVSVFCTAFLRETGLTPNQFRHQPKRKSTFIGSG